MAAATSLGPQLLPKQLSRGGRKEEEWPPRITPTAAGSLRSVRVSSVPGKRVAQSNQFGVVGEHSVGGWFYGFATRHPSSPIFRAGPGEKRILTPFLIYECEFMYYRTLGGKQIIRRGLKTLEDKRSKLNNVAEREELAQQKTAHAML